MKSFDPLDVDKTGRSWRVAIAAAMLGLLLVAPAYMQRDDSTHGNGPTVINGMVVGSDRQQHYCPPGNLEACVDTDDRKAFIAEQYADRERDISLRAAVERAITKASKPSFNHNKISATQELDGTDLPPHAKRTNPP